MHGLTAADFALLEDGKPQQVTDLSEYRDTTTTITTTTTQAAPATPAAAPRAVNRPAPRTLVLLIDSLQLRGRPRAEFFRAAPRARRSPRSTPPRKRPSRRPAE